MIATNETWVLTMKGATAVAVLDAWLTYDMPCNIVVQRNEGKATGDCKIQCNIAADDEKVRTFLDTIIGIIGCQVSKK